MKSQIIFTSFIKQRENHLRKTTQEPEPPSEPPTTKQYQHHITIQIQSYKNHQKNHTRTITTATIPAPTMSSTFIFTFTSSQGLFPGLADSSPLYDSPVKCLTTTQCETKCFLLLFWQIWSARSTISFKLTTFVARNPPSEWRTRRRNYVLDHAFTRSRVACGKHPLHNCVGGCGCVGEEQLTTEAETEKWFLQFQNKRKFWNNLHRHHHTSRVQQVMLEV